MFTEIVSNIIAWCHAYRDCVRYYSLVSCLQRLCQILLLGVMFTDILSNIYSLVSCLQTLCQILKLGVMFTDIVSNIYSLVSCLQTLCLIL